MASYGISAYQRELDQEFIERYLEAAYRITKMTMIEVDSDCNQMYLIPTSEEETVRKMIGPDAEWDLEHESSVEFDTGLLDLEEKNVPEFGDPEDHRFITITTALNSETEEYLKKYKI